MCLKHPNHCKFNKKHDRRNLYDHFMSTKNDCSDDEKDFHRSSKKYEAHGDEQDWDLLIILH